MSDERRPPRIVERDRRRFTPDGRPRAEPEAAPSADPSSDGSPAPGKTGETVAEEPAPAATPAPEKAAPADAVESPTDSSPPASATADSPAAAEDPGPPAQSSAGDEGRGQLAGFLLTLADTYLRVIAAGAIEGGAPSSKTAGTGRKSGEPSPVRQAFAGLEQVLSFFRLLTEDGAEGAADAAPKDDPRLAQLTQLLLAQADLLLRAAAAPAGAGKGGRAAGSPEAEPVLGGAEALAGFQEVIGMVEALERRTRSRRTEDEERMMSRVLYRLRMDYLALAGAPAGAPATD